MIRLFVALPIPNAVGAALTNLQNGLPGARWSAPENFHLTLRFLGEVDHDLGEDVAHGLGRIDAPSFAAELFDLGWFGTKRRPSAVYAQARKCEGLLHLQRKVESVSVRCGLRPESRKYHPHVTLARLKTTSIDGVERYVHERRLAGPLHFEVDRFVLYSSFLSHSGPIYTEEASYPLRLREIAAAE